jgi:endonuclease YncB( thermonuclease family)
MVLHGNAWSYRYQKSKGPYGQEEQLARQERRGLFADPAATEPRVFRKSHGACGSD